MRAAAGPARQLLQMQRHRDTDHRRVLEQAVAQTAEGGKLPGVRELQVRFAGLAAAIRPRSARPCGVQTCC